MSTTRTYRGYTLAEAKYQLELWKKAKAAAATGKSYKIGGRELDRYSLAEINKEISFFVDIISALETSRGGLIKVQARLRRC